EPPSPAIGPSEPPVPSTSAAPENSEQPAAADATDLTAEANRRDTESTSNEKQNDAAETSTRRSTSQSAKRNRDSYVDQFEERRARPAQHHAEVVGRTRDGRLIVRLSNGRTVVLPRVNNEPVYQSYPHRRTYYERPDDFVPPVQPFNPNN
ncbi:MAG TPA: hypothetical protein VFP82_01890, partial [Chthoniobacterales bacterium]|nr:hypothetical protein [Chthoniobacterales bacterium]